LSNWTLALDESGRFEGSLVDGEGHERVGLVVGGVLCPGSAEELDARWRSDLKNLCRQLDVSFPPHGYQLSDHKHAALLDLARTRVSAAGGVWLFLVEPSPAAYFAHCERPIRGIVIS
jgi:hypothetical protein